MPDDCPLCKHPERRSLETQILKGQLTKREVAENILHCRVDEIYEHMTGHITKEQLVDVTSKRNVLLGSLQSMDESLKNLVAERNYGPVATKQMVSLCGEIRKTIMDLNVLEGRVTGEQHITIEQYNDFRSVIVNKIHNLCPKCQEILLKAIEEETQVNDAIIDIKP